MNIPIRLISFSLVKNDSTNRRSFHETFKNSFLTITYMERINFAGSRLDKMNCVYCKEPVGNLIQLVGEEKLTYHPDCVKEAKQETVVKAGSLEKIVEVDSQGMNVPLDVVSADYSGVRLGIAALSAFGPAITGFSYGGYRGDIAASQCEKQFFDYCCDHNIYSGMSFSVLAAIWGSGLIGALLAGVLTLDDRALDKLPGASFSMAGLSVLAAGWGYICFSALGSL